MKNTLFAIVSAITASFTAIPASADWMPEKPISLVVPYGAGGSTDVFGRVLAAEMEKQTGWRVLVENRPGAGGAVGTLAVMNAEPDGYTLGVSATGLFTIQPYMVDGTPEIEPEKMDYLATLSIIPFAIVANSEAPFDNLQELADYSQKSGPVKFASTAKPLAYGMNLMADDMKIKLVSAASSGSSESLQLVLGGHADITISGGVHVPYIEDGRLKVIAFLDERASYAPDVLTVEEQGTNFPVKNMFMVSAPKGLPEEAKAAIVAALDKAVMSEPVQAHGDKLYVNIRNLGPDATSEAVMTQAAFWRDYFRN
ncbi:MAG: Bug family tripartite tricarboxylate transporter substrate binding protein [Thalassovita sp.]